MALRFHIGRMDRDTAVKLFSDDMDDDDFLFSEEFRDWVEECDIKAYFFSTTKDLTGRSASIIVKREVGIVTNRDYSGTYPDDDSIIFESYDAAMLFKLAWL